MKLRKRDVVLMLAGIILLLLAVDFAGIKAGYIFLSAGAAVIIVAISSGWVNGILCGLFFNFSFYSMHPEAGITNIVINTFVYAMFAVLADRIKMRSSDEKATLKPIAEEKNFSTKITNSFMFAHDMLLEMKKGISEGELFSLFARNVSNLTGCDHVLIYASEKSEDETIILKHSYGVCQEMVITQETNKRELASILMRNIPAKDSVLIKNRTEGFVTVVPVKNDKGFSGAAVLYKKKEFSYSDLYIAEYFAAQVFIIIEKKEMMSRMAGHYERIIEALAMAIDIKDHDTHGHSLDTMKYAVQIAKKMNLPLEELEKIKCAALLHDIGKINIATEILRKPSSLTVEEYEKVKKHPQEGVSILNNMKIFDDILPIILYHHEHYDGRGYPEKLKGESIPLGSRICSIADAYSVMLADRPYRNARTKAEAAAELKKCRGTQFDSNIVDVFLEMTDTENAEGEKASSGLELVN